MGREARARFGLIRPERPAKRGPKVYVGYPVGGSVTLPFHASMLRLLGYEMAKGDSRLLAGIEHTQGLYVADNRTMLVQRFLQTPADWLLQIDTDIEFPKTILETLIDLAGTDKKVLAASVPLGSSIPTCAYRLTDKPGIFDEIESVPLRPIQVDGVATAACLVHREVFERIADMNGQSWFHHIYFPKSGAGTVPRDFEFTSQGEDFSFCHRAREAGYAIWCVHVPNVGHYKTQRLSHDNDLARVLAAQDDGVGEIVQEG